MVKMQLEMGTAYFEIIQNNMFGIPIPCKVAYCAKGDKVCGDNIEII